MRKTLRLTVTLPEHTPTAAMDSIGRDLRDVLRRGLTARYGQMQTDIAVASCILPDAPEPTPSDLAAHARASVSDAEWAAYLAATWAAGTSDRD
jgi:hypothetical protein